MPAAEVLSPRDAARVLSDAAGAAYELIGKMRGGESGAHEFRGPDGHRVVVKWDADPRTSQLRGEAVAFAGRLRAEAGWPVPAQAVVDAGDVRFVIQDLMPGAACERLDRRLADELLGLHERRLGLARPADPVHWPGELITTLTAGGDGYCVHASLRGFDARTRALIERIEAFGHSLDPRQLRPLARDIVHWDLHPGNLLVAGGALAAVVDTDFTMIGDARFDLATLAVSAAAVPCEPGVRDRLLHAAGDLDDLAMQAYLAHYADMRIMPTSRPALQAAA